MEWLRKFAMYLGVIQLCMALVCLVWLLRYVGPTIPPVRVPVPVSLSTSSLEAVATFSNRHSLYSEHLEQLYGFLNGAGGTILNGPDSRPSPCPDELPIRQFIPGSNEGMTWARFDRGWVSAAKGGAAFWPEEGEWAIADISDAVAWGKSGGYCPWPHSGLYTFATKLPPCVTEVIYEQIRGGGYQTGWGMERQPPYDLQSPWWFRSPVVICLLAGSYAGFLVAQTPHAGKTLKVALAWAISLVLLTMASGFLVRPVSEFIVISSQPPAAAFVRPSGWLIALDAIAVLTGLALLWIRMVRVPVAEVVGTM